MCKRHPWMQLLVGKQSLCIWKCAAVCCSQDELADVKNFNFDHPSAFDTPALLECVNGLKAGRPVDVPTYDFSTHRRATETKRVSMGGAWGATCPWWVGCSCTVVGGGWLVGGALRSPARA